MQYTIDQDSAKTRLDKFLSKQCPEFSRSQIKKLIQQGKVKVNDKEVSVHQFLKEGDVVDAELGEPKKIVVEENAKVEFKVVHEEDDFLILDKPAGLVVHQGDGHTDPDTLANGLIAKYPEIAKIGDDPIRPGIVHRLDADVSGVMAIAKTQDMFDHLKTQFKTHEVEKEYVALVQGEVSPSEGTIDFPIERKGARMVAKGKGQEGKMAVTEYEVIEANDKSTKLKIVTKTGRMHQIRVHLKAKGWPVVGDKLYGEGGERLMLHAQRLGFKDLKNKKREFIVEAPF